MSLICSHAISSSANCQSFSVWPDHKRACDLFSLLELICLLYVRWYFFFLICFHYWKWFVFTTCDGFFSLLRVISLHYVWWFFQICFHYWEWFVFTTCDDIFLLLFSLLEVIGFRFVWWCFFPWLGFPTWCVLFLSKFIFMICDGIFSWVIFTD